MRAADGSLVRTLDSNPVYSLEEYRRGNFQFVQIPASDGTTLEGSLLTPPDFDPSRKYPVWFMTYGGPHAPTISDTWAGGRVRDEMLAQMGFVGLSNNVPASLTPASDVATLSLFGYDPLVVYTGRAPLEAAAMGIQLGPNDWAIRCNLVTIENEEMRDFTAGHISSEEGRELIKAINGQFADIAPDDVADMECLGEISLKGFHRPLKVFNVRGLQ